MNERTNNGVQFQIYNTRGREDMISMHVVCLVTPKRNPISIFIFVHEKKVVLFQEFIKKYEFQNSWLINVWELWRRE